MATLTARQRSWIRDEVGAGVTDADIDARYEDLQSVRETTISLLRRKITAWVENPATISLSGVASLSYRDNIAAVEKRIATLLKLDDDPSDGSGIDEGVVDAPHVLGQYDIVRARRR